MRYEFDVIVVGAGGGGAVVAKELGEKGVNVLVLEAGPWYGHTKWPYPNQSIGSIADGDVSNLSKEIFNTSFTKYECDMHDITAGRFRWGPANRSRSPWFRDIPLGGFSWQSSGVGGSTLHYFANSVRAFPSAIDNQWPISYRELIPYYEKVEETLPVTMAPMTTKEEMFFYGAKKAGWSYIDTLNVTSPGYRPQQNAILPPDVNINNPSYLFDGKNTGCTLCGHCINGCDIGPSVDKVAKRSTLVSYIPLALKTGNVMVMPNAYATKILTVTNGHEVKVTGVRLRNTWTGEIKELKARIVVMAAGSIETPRLWLNSKLPYNSWVGRGLSNHWYDTISGIFDEKDLLQIVGTPSTESFIGQTSGARLDYPGLGAIQNVGLSPGLAASMLFGLGQDFHFLSEQESNKPWDIRDRVVGEELIKLMQEYPKTLSILVLTDDESNKRNGVYLHPFIKDEHGYIPRVRYYPSHKDAKKREQLAIIAAEILKKAGAKTVMKANSLPNLFAHIECTMRMGYVVDDNCEAFQVKRLFIADNSILFNGLGGANPTLTTQALATRTAEKIADKYF